MTPRRREHRISSSRPSAPVSVRCRRTAFHMQRWPRLFCVISLCAGIYQRVVDLGDHRRHAGASFSSRRRRSAAVVFAHPVQDEVEERGDRAATAAPEAPSSSLHRNCVRWVASTISSRRSRRSSVALMWPSQSVPERQRGAACRWSRARFHEATQHALLRQDLCLLGRDRNSRVIVSLMAQRIARRAQRRQHR